MVVDTTDLDNEMTVYNMCCSQDGIKKWAIYSDLEAEAEMEAVKRRNVDQVFTHTHSRIHSQLV